MVKIKLDNRVVEAPLDSILLEVCRDNGIDVPSLCYMKDVPHFTSCMVCMVRDMDNGKYLPSCSVRVTEGMNIDTCSEEVKALREESLKLLLSEHRAECEAPCRLVCPQDYNIPLFHRKISEGRFEEAAALVSEGQYPGSSLCDKCPGYCEKACRRKMIDSPVSIRSLISFTLKDYGPGEAQDSIVHDSGTDGRVSRKGRFNSVIGRIADEEKKEWLKECKDGYVRHSLVSQASEAVEEAGSCMHCDCRAADNCRLRDLSDEAGVKNPVRLKGGNPIVKKTDPKYGVIFENAKCIKCGLCVRVVTDSNMKPALAFTGRGFMTIISEPLTAGFDELDPGLLRKGIEVCPTGALSFLEIK